MAPDFSILSSQDFAIQSKAADLVSLLNELSDAYYESTYVSRLLESIVSERSQQQREVRVRLPIFQFRPFSFAGDRA